MSVNGPENVRPSSSGAIRSEIGPQAEELIRAFQAHVRSESKSPGNKISNGKAIASIEATLKEPNLLGDRVVDALKTELTQLKKHRPDEKVQISAQTGDVLHSRLDAIAHILKFTTLGLGVGEGTAAKLNLEQSALNELSARLGNPGRTT
jgi:hypothetical protein